MLWWWRGIRATSKIVIETGGQGNLNGLNNNFARGSNPPPLPQYIYQHILNHSPTRHWRWCWWFWPWFRNCWKRHSFIMIFLQIPLPSASVPLIGSANIYILIDRQPHMLHARNIRTNLISSSESCIYGYLWLIMHKNIMMLVIPIIDEKFKFSPYRKFLV